MVVRLLSLSHHLPPTHQATLLHLILPLLPSSPHPTPSVSCGQVRRWTKRSNVFSKELLLAPIHCHGNHWTLAVKLLLRVGGQREGEGRGGHGKRRGEEVLGGDERGGDGEEIDGEGRGTGEGREMEERRRGREMGRARRQRKGHLTREVGERERERRGEPQEEEEVIKGSRLIDRERAMTVS